jgi:hypothetical protein
VTADRGGSWGATCTLRRGGDAVGILLSLKRRGHLHPRLPVCLPHDQQVSKPPKTSLKPRSGLSTTRKRTYRDSRSPQNGLYTCPSQVGHSSEKKPEVKLLPPPPSASASVSVASWDATRCGRGNAQKSYMTPMKRNESRSGYGTPLVQASSCANSAVSTFNMTFPRSFHRLQPRF